MTTTNLYGQKNVTHQRLIWYGVFTTLNINEKWFVQSEVQERHFINPIAQHQFVVRSHIHRVFGNSGWESSVGMCLFLQNPNDPNSTITLTVPELRPHIEFGYNQKLAKVSFDQRFRAEARFFHETNSIYTELEDGFNFGNFRFRYKFQSTIPLIKISNQRYFKIKISNEIHINAGNKITKNVFDQNRIYAGISFDVLKNLAFDMGYLNWFQQRPNGDFYNRDIVRFTVFHKVDLHKTNK